MTIETFLYFLQQYGYLLIFVLVFCGIVGIPAPEESLIFLIGMLIAQHQLSISLSLLSIFSGILSGMLLAYAGGRLIGVPLVLKFGKWIGMTHKRWRKVEAYYKKNSSKTLLFGFYLPGLRQISPYVAGMTHIPFLRFTALSVLGTILWTIPFLGSGYFIGRTYHTNPKYAPYVGLALLLLFIGYLFISRIRRRRSQ